MDPIKLQKDTRLTIRLNSLIKDAVEEEAKNQGLNLTDFVTLTLIKAADFNKADFVNQ